MRWRWARGSTGKSRAAPFGLNLRRLRLIRPRCRRHQGPFPSPAHAGVRTLSARGQPEAKQPRRHHRNRLDSGLDVRGGGLSP